jgi:wyosine [tRNA(Phe)-imidazoG37] synthetase (radical SAM superfamily)
MATFLFEGIVFGPVSSRRLGKSLGVNIMPSESKMCNYNCIYCECGWSQDYDYDKIPNLEKFSISLEKHLSLIKTENEQVDVITFAGNGEPSLHPEFLEIVEETIRLRNIYLPNVKIAVLTNATRLEVPSVVEALNKVDYAILKIDTAIQRDYEMINCPNKNLKIVKIADLIKLKLNNAIIQTMFFKARVNDFAFDNTSEESLIEYLNLLQNIAPKEVMIYSIARDTPMQGLQKIEFSELKKIGDRIQKLGIKTLITP